MGLSKKDKERMKKLTEARMRKKREREDQQHETGEGGSDARLGEELRYQTADSARATPPSTTSKPTSRSSFKLDNVPEMEITEKSHRRYKIVDMDNLIEWTRSFARCDCGKKMNIKEDQEIGNVSHLVSTCSDCDKKFEMCTSTGGVTKSSDEKETCPYDVHNKLVMATLQSSSGYAGIQELGACLNSKMLSQTTYDKLGKKIYDDTVEHLEKVMENTRDALHSRLQENGDNNEVKNIRVSCDGSWSKRGFTSMYGFVAVIEMTTGWVIDFVILSKWCKVCAMSNKEAPPPHECTKNFKGSSPAMEVEGWKQLWSRSIEKCKFRYHEVVSDGDSKGFVAVRNLNIYPVAKFECTNHVAKRIGTALRKAKTSKKLVGKKEGSLTEDKITRLSHYFGRAIKNETTVEDMKNSIYSTLRHCMSTDVKPEHSTCPDGRMSWCFYKRAVARNEKIPKHKQKMKTYLRQDVVTQILPIYQRIVTPELLQKCKGETQNSNESLHSVIWSELPKTKFFSLKRMEYSIYRCVVKFNHGAVALAKAIGDASWTPSIERDKKRKRKSVKTEEKKKEEKKKIRKIQEEEEKIAAEGETYGAGIAPV